MVTRQPRARLSRETGETMRRVDFGEAGPTLPHFPERVELACGPGGVDGLWHRLDGHRSDEVHSHTPLE